MTVTEYITNTFIDTYQPSLPLFTYLYKPSSYNDDLNKPLILLLHGAGGDHHHFDDVLPTLVENGYYTMVCDLRYHGRSQPNYHHGEPIFDFTVILQDLDRALEWFQKKLGLTKMSIVLGGISMGGMIAQVYAHHLLFTPERIKIHALIGIGCGHIQIKDPAIPWMEFYRTASYCDARAIIPAARQSILDSAHTYTGKSKSASTLCFVDDRILFYCFQACANVPFTFVHDLFSVPQLLMRGQFDLHTIDVMEAWYSNAKKSNSTNVLYKVIPCAGHLVTVDKGRMIAEHIINFLSSQ